MEKIIIRNVKFEDLKSVADIATRGWQTAYRGIVDDDYLNNLSIEEKEYIKNNRNKAKTKINHY